MNYLETMLLAVKNELLPLTRQEVAKGGHVFGGLVLDRETLKVVAAGSNRRQRNPLFHGEIDTLNRFFTLPQRPSVEGLLFLASHDPCPMCAAAIAWAGFTDVWTLFDYKDVQKTFGMPVDLLMYRELFGCDGTRDGNPFFTRRYIKDAVGRDPEKARLQKLLGDIEAEYADLPVQDFDYPAMNDRACF